MKVIKKFYTKEKIIDGEKITWEENKTKIDGAVIVPKFSEDAYAKGLKLATVNDITWANVLSKPTTATRWPSWSEVTSKPSTFVPSAHDQAWSTITSPPATATRWPAWSEVTSKPTTATRWPTWSEVTSKPTTFAPSAHNQAWSTITSKPTTATRWPSWSEVTSRPTIPSLDMYGNNANGFYWRFSDGLQICLYTHPTAPSAYTERTVSGGYGVYYNWHYPAPFYDNDHTFVFATGDSSGWAIDAAGVWNVARTYCAVGLMSGLAITNVRLQTMAIGRWK